MNEWSLLAELHVELPRPDLRDYVRAQFGTGLRRAGISTEFTLASAVACWRRLEPEPARPCLALIWTSPAFSGTENMQCLAELLEVKSLPMPFQFIASQPHLAAVYANHFLPGLAYATTLVHSSADAEGTLLAGLSCRQPWTHVLLGEVWTPCPMQAGGDRFKASWRVLGRRIGRPGSSAGAEGADQEIAEQGPEESQDRAHDE
jgi:hypothetical protein